MAPTDPTVQVSSVTYRELADIESDFEDLNTELLIQQAVSERSLYERRSGLLRKVAGFWPLVLEHAPPEIDQYIQPGDAAILGNCLEDIEVTRFEIGDSATSKDNGEPRSFAIRFTFAENDIFEDRVLEKHFWYRHAPVKEAKEAEEGDDKKKKKENETAESWSGIVSEPVAIKWKKGKDQTGGLLDLAVKVYQEGEKSASVEALTEELSKTAMGGISFFAWFGYVGRRVSAEESKAAATLKREQRAERAAKRAKGEKEAEEEQEEGDDDDDDAIEIDDDSYEYEIFSDGDIVALAFAEDLWPNAIKYFRQAQEEDTLSDIEFEDMDEDGEDGEDDDDDEDEGDAPPPKKQRT
ncbi:hypothetical protein SCUCBS95973_005455 [Sporothrix curviconia]|uniref:Nap family protein n=1 Tax=Sporothrix curviconia TaxID=1260050 RepID=A0ABP0BX01_9PEZI